MAFLDKNGLQTLTNKLTQGDAIRVASHRGHTVSKVLENIQRECDNISTPNTMSIENKVNNFKVGQGKDIDVVGDVEQGKLDIEFKGKTYQNLLKDNIDIVISNEVQHSGQKLFYFTSKPNVPFTVILNLNYAGEKTQFFIRGYKGDNTYAEFGFSNYITNYNGIMKILCNQNLELGCKSILIGVRNAKHGTTFSNVIVLEGDYTQVPINELPNHFNNIHSSFEDGIVDITVKGINLFNNSKHTLDTRGPGVKVEKLVNGHYKVSYTAENMQWDWGASTSYPFTNTEGRLKIKAKKNSPIFISAKGEFDNVTVMERDDNNATLASKQYSNNKQITHYVMSDNINFIEIIFTKGVIKSSFELYDICIGHGICPTEYEPYCENKYTFNIGEPLRSLPNGVADEIKGNKLIRRIEKMVLDGLKNKVYLYKKYDNVCVYHTAKIENHKATNQISLISDILSSKGSHMSVDEGISQLKNYIYIRIGLSKTDEGNINNYLQSNPITVYYELAEPIVTELTPISIDIKPLYTVNINSYIAPNSIHIVQLNRAAQIERSIIEIAELKKRVDILESTYNTYFLENYHKLNLLNLEYEMERTIN